MRKWLLVNLRLINDSLRLTPPFLIMIIWSIVSPLALAQISWTEHPDSPVFGLGPSGSWDDATVFDASVIRDGDTLKMWYTGNDVPQNSAINFKIGYAWSLDGLSWVRLDGPVIAGRPGFWDSYGVAGPSVILDGDTLRMWYVSTLPSQPGKGLGYATSVDGITWTRRDSPILETGPPNEWDGSYLVSGDVIKKGGMFELWFSGALGSYPFSAITQIGYATSSDGINWTKYDDPATTAAPYAFSDPVVKVGSPGAFDDYWAWVPGIYYTGMGYEMWYTGNGGTPRVQAIGYATSPDGIVWTKHPNNPVFVCSNAWSAEVAAASVIRDGNQYRMWFSGFVPGVRGRIGYATSPAVTGAEIHEEQGYNSNNYKLFQNYPNPFNPETTIIYSIPNREFVTLKIYNLLGTHIETLVSEEKSAGEYRVTFDADHLSSGIYFYRMTTGSYSESQKMILLH